MKDFRKLKFDFHDGRSFQARDKKDLLQKIFYRDTYLEKVLEQSKFIIVGEKGTGKTIYAQYIENTSPENNIGKRIEVDKFDYLTFLGFQKSGIIKNTPYIQVWRMLLYYEVCKLIYDKRRNENKWGIFGNELHGVADAIAQFGSSAYSPETEVWIKLVQNAEAGASAAYEGVVKVAGKISEEVEKSNIRINTPIQKLNSIFETVFSKLSLNNNYILFIDGIDMKPKGISLSEYISCLEELFQATVQVNDFFRNIRDCPGRPKVVLLLRPDILSKMNVHNLNARLNDNSVVLNWETQYNIYRASSIFEMIDGVIRKQQENQNMFLGKAWDHYFNFTITDYRSGQNTDNPFLYFLRYSWYRPRDIVMHLNFYQGTIKDNEKNGTEHFSRCKNSYSGYLWGEVRDYLNFYFDPVYFEIIRGFFRYLDKSREFSYENFLDAHKQFCEKHKDLFSADEGSSGLPTESHFRVSEPDEFLQLLFSANVICWRKVSDRGVLEDHWAFRERSVFDLEPQVETNEKYAVHSALRSHLKVVPEMVSVPEA